MVAYCATTLQGATCVDSRCPYSHDVFHCQPCGRSFPAALLTQHQSAQQHLRSVAAKAPPIPSIPQTPLPQSPSPFSDLLSAPSNTSRPSGASTPTSDVGPRVSVSDEGGLDFVAEGIGTADKPSLPSITHTILVEKTNVLSSLTVQSMKLTPSPNPCFVARLLGKTLEVRKSSVRRIEVSFNAPRVGVFQGALRITFKDKTRSDEEFTVTRELRGRAVLADSPAKNGEPSNMAKEGPKESGRDGVLVWHDLRAEGVLPDLRAGVSVSDDLGLEFSVERSRLDEPFATQARELVITKTSVIPLVSLMGARVSSQDGSVASWSTRLEGDSQWIKFNQPNAVTVCFTPQREGFCEAVIELIFCDHKHKADFTIKRKLSGRAKQPEGRLQIEYMPNTGPQPVDDQVDNNAGIPVGEELLDNDGTGITVSHADGLDFGIVERMHRNGPFATSSSLLTIKHEDNFPAVTFIMGRIKTSDESDRDFSFKGSSHDIQPGMESTMRVIFRPRFEGVFKAILELVFYHTQVSVWFVVRRRLQGIAGSLKDHKHFESLGQEDDLRMIKSRAASPQKTILLLSPDRRYFPECEAPPIVQETVDKSTGAHPYDEDALGLLSALMPDSLNMNTYAHYFNALIAIEDGHRQWDVISQPSYEVGVQGRGNQYSIEIENNDEDLLPEVARGDFLWLDDVQDDIRYEARVTDVDVFTRRHLAVLKVSLRLPTDFHLHQGSEFDVRFRYNRISLRRQYRALMAALAPPRRLLFPSESDLKPLRRLSRAEIDNLKYRQLVNKEIRDDSQQLQAVISILEQPQGSVPFIVCGPPGTGKTSTIVESIVQLIRRDASVRVLVCTPSNPAADLLAERLAAAGLDSDKLYRLDTSSHYEEDMFEDARASSLYPGHERLLAFRVVLSTCSSAGMLQALNVPVGHFSHIVIDEAAQAEEPLAMIPIIGFSNLHTNVILAGDPNQLGPNIKSPTAARAGLGKSYLERLLMHEVYGLDTQAGKTIVVLHRNRRSHGHIIAWSNRYLYEDIIRDYGNPYITYHLVLSDVLPKKGFPVVFHGVKGGEQHAKRSTPYFNIIEASIVRDYCVNLTGDPERKIYPEEIGVIAPYKAQLRAIRELLKVAKLSDITVGSVEQFQGQERKVIILAATRSNEEGSYTGNGLDFLMNRHRTNVAITRAQALLIVIGDPEVLGKDELWRTFLNYIKSREGWTGKMHSWKTDEVYLSGYEIVPRKKGVMYGEEFIGGKSENICRSSEVSGG